jgi:hypothetical protein
MLLSGFRDRASRCSAVRNCLDNAEVAVGKAVVRDCLVVVAVAAADVAAAAGSCTPVEATTRMRRSVYTEELPRRPSWSQG